MSIQSYLFAVGTLAPFCAICGTAWTCTSQQRAFCIYAAYRWTGKYTQQARTHTRKGNNAAYLFNPCQILCHC